MLRNGSKKKTWNKLSFSIYIKVQTFFWCSSIMRATFNLYLKIQQQSDEKKWPEVSYGLATTPFLVYIYLQCDLGGTHALVGLKNTVGTLFY